MSIISLPSRASEKPVKTELCCCCVFYGSGQVMESVWELRFAPFRMTLGDAMVFYSVLFLSIGCSFFLPGFDLQEMDCWPSAVLCQYLTW